MDSSFKSGLMAVCAVSGSVVFVAMQVHKRLLSKFMDKIEFEITNSTETKEKKEEEEEEPKKKVRFADDVAETMRNRGREKFKDENLDAMPENWQAMYREILHQRHHHHHLRISN